ncbi:MAG: imidazole glycerol phosphate synthase subunit HisH [Nitrospirae bacterium]|nr:imidazole glycerol phosphate synthase subunit HisH [Nitrospirota bacterium]
MENYSNLNIAIVDYGMGNLFSIKNACNTFGISTVITSSREEIANANALILPGVGAFGDAMKILEDLNLIDTILEFVSSSKPIFGICLGMQLMMTESLEFGVHKGLGIIDGNVVPFDNLGGNTILKVPHIGWSRINGIPKKNELDPWQDTMLNGLNNGEYMYFVHSFYVKPRHTDISISYSQYGNVTFTSSFQYKNIFACQFHPEKSGLKGLEIYKNFINRIVKQTIKGD